MSTSRYLSPKAVWSLGWGTWTWTCHTIQIFEKLTNSKPPTSLCKSLHLKPSNTHRNPNLQLAKVTNGFWMVKGQSILNVLFWNISLCHSFQHSPHNQANPTIFEKRKFLPCCYRLNIICSQMQDSHYSLYYCDEHLLRDLLEWHKENMYLLWQAGINFFFSIKKNHPPILLYLSPYCNPSANGQWHRANRRV